MKGKRLIRTPFFCLSNESGYPELGVSAIEHLISCLNSLLEVDWPSSPKFGKTTFNIGTISGGAASNIVPGFSLKHCTNRS
jgi:Peptidase dimerisation domain